MNHYYRHVGPRVLISKDGRRYRETVAGIARRAALPTFRVPVEVSIDLYPPDNRRRDVDNSLLATIRISEHEQTETRGAGGAGPPVP